MSIADLPDFLTVEETAAVLRIGRTSAYAEIRRWETTHGRSGIASVRFGRSVRVPKAVILRLLDPAQPLVATEEGAPMPHEIVVALDCRDVRADVGPVAWMVLEELVLSGEPGDRHLMATTTVRNLAASLGISKDTVASGMRRLIALGIVEREDMRDGASGCFGNSVYFLHLDGTGLSVQSPDGPKPDPVISDTVGAAPAPPSQRGVDQSGPERRPSRRAQSVDQSVSQLSLLDAADPTTTGERG